MKSTHNKSTQTDVKYPCLMVASDGDVVLFNKHKCGTLISSASSCSIGHYSEEWAMKYFTPLPPTESVTLQNN